MAADVHRSLYLEHIRSLLPTQIFVPEEAGDGETFRVESGLVIAAAAVGAAARPPPPAPLTPGARVVDASGHARPHYRGLLCYCWARAATALLERDPALANDWMRLASESCASTPLTLRPDLRAKRIPAADGGKLIETVWDALAATAALEGGDPGLCAAAAEATTVFALLLAQQDSAGPFLQHHRSDNPEMYWYHELVLLHAVASYASLTGLAVAANAAARHVEWFQAEAEPDHATGEPWGLHAFISNPATRLLADQVLHAVRIRHPTGAGGVGLMLLADALYCLSAPASRG